jgi:hypothetical protein
MRNMPSIFTMKQFKKHKKLLNKNAFSNIDHFSDNS